MKTSKDKVPTSRESHRMDDVDITIRYAAPTLPAVVLFVVNGNAQNYRMATGASLYQDSLGISLGISELLTDHASSFATPFVCATTGCFLVSKMTDNRHRVGATIATATTLFTGYEFYQADFTTGIDQGDLAAVFLGSVLCYGLFSERMPWNRQKPAARKFDNDPHL